MKNLIIIFACLVVVAAHASTKNSETVTVEFLPTCRPLQTRTTFAELPPIQPTTCRHLGRRYYYYYRPDAFAAGTRNFNYNINFSVKSSSIGFDEPHFNGARTDGNAIFIDGVRMLSSSAVNLGAIGFK